MERTNSLHVQLSETVDLVTIDVVWTKQSEILSKALSVVEKEGNVISLVKLAMRKIWAKEKEKHFQGNVI